MPGSLDIGFRDPVYKIEDSTVCAERLVKMEKTEVKKETVIGRAIDKYKGTYILKPCKETYLKQINPKHDGARLFTEAKIFLSPERDSQTGLIKTGLTDQEARELEQEMGLKPMDLSPFSSFWHNHRIFPKVPQEGIVLNLERSAVDRLMYLFTKVQSKVALSWKEAEDDPRKLLVLTSDEKEAKTESTKVKIKIEAMKKLSEMSLIDQMNFLKVYDQGKYKVGKSSTPDFVVSMIGKIADEAPDKFLETLENRDLKTMVFLQDCIDAGIVKRSGSKYLIAGGEVIGNTYLDTIENIEKPEFNGAKISMKAKLDALK